MSRAPYLRPLPWMKAVAKEYSAKSHDKEWQRFTYEELLEIIKRHYYAAQPK